MMKNQVNRICEIPLLMMRYRSIFFLFSIISFLGGRYGYSQTYPIIPKGNYYEEFLFEYPSQTTWGVNGLTAFNPKSEAVEKLIFYGRLDDDFFLNTLPAYRHVKEVVISHFTSKRWLKNIADWITENPSIQKVRMVHTQSYTEEHNIFFKRLKRLSHIKYLSDGLISSRFFSPNHDTIQSIQYNDIWYGIGLEELNKLKSAPNLKTISVSSTSTEVSDIIESLTRFPSLREVHWQVNDITNPYSFSPIFKNISQLEKLTSIHLSLNNPYIFAEVDYTFLEPFLALKDLRNFSINGRGIYMVDILEFLSQHQGIDTMELHAQGYRPWSEDELERAMNGTQTPKRGSDYIRYNSCKSIKIRFKYPSGAFPK